MAIDALSLSPSAIDLLLGSDGCGHAYGLRYLYGWRPAPAVLPVELEAGSLAHAALAEAGRAVLAREALPHGVALGACLDRVLAARTGTPPDPKAALRARRVLDAAGPLVLEDLLHVEEAWTMDVDGVQVRGRWDRIDAPLRGMRLRVVDYKTGDAPQTREELEASAQCSLYLAAAHARWPNAQVEMRYLFLVHGHAVSVPWAPDIDAHARGLVRAAAERVRAGHLEARVGSHCARCDFRTACPHYAAFLARPVPAIPEVGGLPAALEARRVCSTLSSLAEARRKEIDRDILRPALEALAKAGEDARIESDGYRVKLSAKRREEYPDADETLEALAEALEPNATRDPARTQARIVTLARELLAVDVSKLHAWLKSHPTAVRSALERVLKPHAAEDVVPYVDGRAVSRARALAQASEEEAAG